MIGPGSRYKGVAVLHYQSPEGEVIPYLARREIPTFRGTSLGTYTTRKGDRLDSIAARTLGNPLLFWEIADANALVDPLLVPTTQGYQLLIPLPAPKAS